MKARELAKKFAYIGLGAGLVSFAIYGLLPGSFIGGVIGLKLASLLFGIPTSPTIFSRVIVAICMLFGVMVSGVIFIVGSSVIGWITGYSIVWLLSHMKQRKKIHAR